MKASFIFRFQHKHIKVRFKLDSRGQDNIHCSVFLGAVIYLTFRKTFSLELRLKFKIYICIDLSCEGEILKSRSVVTRLTKF